MPSFLYTGPGVRVYAELQGPDGTLVVNPGDICALSEAPADGYWVSVPSDTEDIPTADPGQGGE